MPSMLLLRILLLACAVSGSLVIACSDSTSPSGNTGDDDSDDDDSDDDNADDDNSDDDSDDDKPAKDAGKNDGGRRDGGGSGCPAIPVERCETDDGAMGFKTCNPSTGKFGECATISGADAGTVEECPEPFMCTTSALGSFCSMGGGGLAGIIMCTEASECEDQGLTGASCTMLGGFGVCQLRCVGGTPPTPRADAGGDDETSDAGAGSVDAGRDASSGASDARVDSGRDR